MHVRDREEHLQKEHPHESEAKAQGTETSKVAQRMTPVPVTVQPTDGINEALAKMKKGHFRHLPVVSEEGRLMGMLSDRDLRLIRPSLAFASEEEASLQLWSTAVRQGMVFNPVSVGADASIETAAELMLHWEIGALPVVKDGDVLVGIITYADLLRELVARKRR